MPPPLWGLTLTGALVQRSMSNTPSYNVYRNQGKFEHCKLLCMNCGQKLFNPPSCAARLQQMTMTYGKILLQTIRIVQLRSHCVATSRFAITTLPKRAMELVLSLYHCPVMSKAGQMKEANKASKFGRTIPHSTKSGSQSVLLYFLIKKISINDTVAADITMKVIQVVGCNDF